MTDDPKDPANDQALGMRCPITRRDFLNGIAVGATAMASQPLFAAAPGEPQGTIATPSQDMPGYYPPALTGLRGDAPGSFENAHALRDGHHWSGAADTGEHYDLIVVGGGISGLAAAHFYRANAGANSRILILDNHDDFGGHAKRNEFHLDGRLELMNGGTEDIDSPRPYSRIAMDLIKTLGIDVPALQQTTQHHKFYEEIGLQNAAFFDRETFGADKLCVGLGKRPIAEVLADAPLSPRARAKIAEIEEGDVDYLPGLSSDEKKQRLSRISYEAFLRDDAHAEPAVLHYYHARTMGEWGVGTDAVSALDCWGFHHRIRGFQGMHLAKGSIERMGPTPAGYEDTGGSPFLHFPDGNATIARSLVRDLIPAALPGAGVENIVTARADYGKLDRDGEPVRLRLNSTVIRARNLGEPQTAREVEISYVRHGRAYKARARGAVLAGYNMMIPYLVPELPAVQRAALHALVKTPLVYASVALRDWRAFAALKVGDVYSPGSYFPHFYLNPRVDIGAYRAPTSPGEPILVHMVRTPCKPGLSEHDQNKVGRSELLITPFATFERRIRDQLGRSLGGGGFDPARDITAITVNRHAHGYAPEFNPLWDPDVPPAERANVVGRAQFGRLTIANSDAGGEAYTDSAINQGFRAVMELLSS
ncbi:MAG TPA: FAD/NAD(P)-binding protein [Steroidobacteraceae bacterium]|nr:FAD/NAD(P)-binding protein [Steroidobacteraceae bacterium]